jgi:hypothetical protein
MTKLAELMLCIAQRLHAVSNFFCGNYGQVPTMFVAHPYKKKVTGFDIFSDNLKRNGQTYY